MTASVAGPCFGARNGRLPGHCPQASSSLPFNRPGPTFADQTRRRDEAQSDGCLSSLDSTNIGRALMMSAAPDHWQIQDAKQRFSEMIRAVTSQILRRTGDLKELPVLPHGWLCL